jgi:ABC-type molybdate transport system substrate-binding protein
VSIADGPLFFSGSKMNAMWNWLLVTFVSLVFAFPAFATEVHVLSAGAIELGLVVAADAFRKETGNTVTINYATTPEIRRRLGTG